MLIEALRGKVVVPVDDIHDNRPPCDDVAVLRFFVKTDKAANDVGTETRRDQSVKIRLVATYNKTYGMRAASVSARLLCRSARSSWYMRKRICT